MYLIQIFNIFKVKYEFILMYAIYIHNLNMKIHEIYVFKVKYEFILVSLTLI